MTIWEGSRNKGVPMICIPYFPHARILLLLQNKTSLAALIISDLLQRHSISPKFCCVGGILCSSLKILDHIVLFFFSPPCKKDHSFLFPSLQLNSLRLPFHGPEDDLTVTPLAGILALLCFHHYDMPGTKLTAPLLWPDLLW